MQPNRYSTVLVAIVNSPRDWAIVRDLHWYRIPLRRIPQRGVNAPVLAFYQTKAFEAQRWSINYYAFATAWEVMSRIQLLPEEPDHPRAQELYYKVHLGELIPLPRPIVSQKWRRINFIVTHWERLQGAQEVSELLHGSIWEERLWRALRKMGRLAEENDWDEW